MSHFHRSVTWVVGNLLFGVVLVISHAAPIKAADETGIKTGDMVVVTANSAELKISKRVVGVVKKGEQLKVEDVQANWLWVRVNVDGKLQGGWLQSRFVKRIYDIPPSTADSFWAWAEKKNTAQAYRCFIYRHPDDDRTAQAKQRWAELDFTELQKESEIRSACWRFLALHPNSQFADQVAEKYRQTHASAANKKPATLDESPIRKRAIEVLLSSAEDPKSNAYQTAVFGLAELGDHGATDVLLAALVERRMFGKWRIARALGRIGDARTIVALTELLKSPQTRSRDDAAAALAHIGSKEALEKLFVALHQKDRKIQVAATRGLTKVCNQRAIEALIAVAGDADSGARREAVQALGRIGDPQAVAVLMRILKNSESRSVSHRLLRLSSAHALGEIGDPSVTDPLLQVFTQSTDDNIGSACAKALSKIVDPSAVPALVAELDGGRTWSKASAASALGRIGDKRALHPLLNVLRDPNYKHRSSAAYALGNIGDVGAVAALLTSLHDSELTVRTGAASALRKIGDTRGVPALLSLLKDSNQGLRGTISRTDKKKIIEADVTRPIYILNIVLALHELLDRDEFLSLMRQSHQHSDLRVRQFSLMMLGQFGDSRDVEPLIRALKSDPSQYVRSQAARALAKIGDKRAIDALVLALKDTSNVSKAAESALAKTAIKHGTRALRSAANSTNEKVRQGVTAALAAVAKQRSELLLSEHRLSETQSTRDNTPTQTRNRGGDILAQIRAAGSRASIGDLSGLETLRKGMKSQSIDARIAAVAGLADARKHQPKVLDDLKSALAEETSPTVTVKITGVLANAKDPDALRDLQQYLKSEDPVERIYAGQVLGKTGRHGVADELVSALDDTDPLVRVHAATAIIRVLDAQAAAADSKDQE